MSDPKIGLALGGGAARGLAHIEMLHAFDDLGIKPAVLSGCSAGSLVAAGYAAGMSAAEIEDHARSRLSNRLDAMRLMVSSRTGSMLDFVSLKGFGSLQIDGKAIVQFALPSSVPDLIEELAIPLLIVATDYAAMSEKVFRSGPLRQAVAASVAIPGIIDGPAISGRLMIDGGMTNPVPFDILKPLADIVIAVDVTGRPSTGKGKHPSNMELGIGGMVIAFHQIAALKRKIDPPDFYFQPPVEQFQAHEFFRLNEILEAARPSRDALKRSLEDIVNSGVKSGA